MASRAALTHPTAGSATPRSGLPAAIVGLVLLAPSIAEGEASADAETERERRWTEGTSARIDLGPAMGLYVAPGFELRAEWQLWTWRHGEIGVGGLVAAHFDAVEDRVYPLLGVDVSGTNANAAIAATVGHTFRLWGRRIGLGAHIVGGAYIRAVDTTVRDRAHDVDESHEGAGAVAFVGLSVSLGVRITDYLGVNVHGVVPLLGTTTMYAYPFILWEMAKPYGAIALSAYL